MAWPEPNPTSTIALVLAEEGGRWRIDELIVLPDDPSSRQTPESGNAAPRRFDAGVVAGPA